MTRLALPLGAVCVLAGTLVLTCACQAQEEGASPTSYTQWKHGPPSDPSYFPIAVWLQQASNAPRYKAAGFNLYIGLWEGPTEEQLADLTAQGMPVICAQNAVGLKHLDDPIIVGWMHGDEPDNAQPAKDPVTGADTWGPCVPPASIVSDYEQVRAKDPTRPVMLNLGQGVANDDWYGRGNGASLDDYATYVQGGDIISYDVYPVVGIDKPDGENYLWYIPKGLDRLTAWTAGKRLLWNVVECTRIGMPDKCATPAQVKAEVWMSLVHGSRGIVYFAHQFAPSFCEWALLEEPAMLAAVTAINHQITELAPVLNSPTVADAAQVQSASAEVPVDAMVKQVEGATYVFAVGMRNAPTQATFTVADLAGRQTAEVLGEGRSVPVVEGQFSDDFGAYGVHLYRIQ
jgi:hypothetical protein